MGKAEPQARALSLCGEMASKPLGALALIALGYRSLSLSATAHGPVKAMILDLDAKRRRRPDAAARSALRQRLDPQKLTEFAEAEGLSL